MSENFIPSVQAVREIYAGCLVSENEVTEEEDGVAEFDRWLARYRESIIDEVEDHLVRRDQFTERTLAVIDELRKRRA